MNVQEYLTKKGYDYNVINRPAGPQAVMNCPKCGDREKKFSINTETGAFNCMHLNNCGWKGSFRDFQIFHNDEPTGLIGDNNFSVKKREYDIPKKKTEDVNKEIYIWFNKRGISKNTVDHFRIGKYQNQIAFKFYENGVFKNCKYRDMKEKKFHQEKNAAPVLYNRDNVPEESEELIICEGEIDALTWHQYGFHSVVSINSGANDKRWIEYNFKWLERFKKIFLSMDMDEAGRKEVEEISNRLGAWRVYDIELPYKDCNECLQNKVDKETITNALLNAKGFDREEIVCAVEYKELIIKNMLEPEKDYGRKTGIELLDNKLKGWRGGEITVWTGRNGSGKTTAIMEVLILDIINEAKKGNLLPGCLGSFEMRPEVLLSWGTLQLQYLNGHIRNPDGITRLEIEKLIESIFWQMYVINIKDVISEDMLFDLYEFAAQKYGCKVFILDSLMRVRLKNKKDKYEGQAHFMDRLARFADKFDCHVHLVVHPRKGEKDTDAPDSSAVKGAGEITDIAHNVISIYRLSDDQVEKIANELNISKSNAPTSLWHLHKNRMHGLTGSKRMIFDEQYKIFKEF